MTFQVRDKNEQKIKKYNTKKYLSLKPQPDMHKKAPVVASTIKMWKFSWLKWILLWVFGVMFGVYAVFGKKTLVFPHTLYNFYTVYNFWNASKSAVCFVIATMRIVGGLNQIIPQIDIDLL